MSASVAAVLAGLALASAPEAPARHASRAPDAPMLVCVHAAPAEAARVSDAFSIAARKAKSPWRAMAAPCETAHATLRLAPTATLHVHSRGDAMPLPVEHGGTGTAWPRALARACLSQLAAAPDEPLSVLDSDAALAADVAPRPILAVPDTDAPQAVPAARARLLGTPEPRGADPLAWYGRVGLGAAYVFGQGLPAANLALESGVHMRDAAARRLALGVQLGLGTPLVDAATPEAASTLGTTVQTSQNTAHALLALRAGLPLGAGWRTHAGLLAGWQGRAVSTTVGPTTATGASHAALAGLDLDVAWRPGGACTNSGAGSNSVTYTFALEGRVLTGGTRHTWLGTSVLERPSGLLGLRMTVGFSC